VFIGGPGGEPPDVDKMEVLITSVGSAQQNNTLLNEIAASEGVSSHDLMSEAIGDVGGLLIAKSDDGALNTKIRGRNDRTNGISLERISALAKEATKSNSTKPGVVVFAVGEDKAPVVYKCLQLRIIKELICDNGLYRKLRELLPQPPSTA
jgi:DNA-binding transcriptional regulator LsrR (DeoR family)